MAVPRAMIKCLYFVFNLQSSGAATAEKAGRESMKHETAGGAVKSEGAAGASEPGRDSDTHKPPQGGDVKSGSPAEVPGRSNMGR